MSNPPHVRLRLIDNWRAEAKRLWSVRVAAGHALFWSLACGLWLLWPALAGAIPLPVYFGVGLLLAGGTGVARFLKQPGTE